MELQKYDSIQDLTTTRFDWNCRLRLQCVWRASNPKTKELWGLNMIYIDDSVSMLNLYNYFLFSCIIQFVILTIFDNKICRTIGFMPLPVPSTAKI